MGPEEITQINSFALFFSTAMVVLMLFLPRKIAVLPMIAVACFITLGQRVMILNNHFTIMRIVVLFGWLRLLLRREFFPLRWNAMDKVIICWAIVNIAANTLLFGTYEVFKNRLGFSYNVLGMYFLFRFLVRDAEDINYVVKIIGICSIFLAALMILEKSTGRNMFSYFGGVKEFTEIRGGRIRCQGPFSHPILAGTFGATILPLFLAQYCRRLDSRWLSFAAIVSASIITFTSSSSGPAIAYFIGVSGMCLWIMHKRRRWIWQGALLGLLGLAIVMKAPVYYLIQRVNIFSGSTGDHRAYIIKLAIDNIGDWWLLGSKSPNLWGEFDGPFLDITNQYIAQGIDAGLAGMILFITIIVLGFCSVGSALKYFDMKPGRDSLLVWALGVSLFAHAISFLSITYFDQMVVFWYLLLSIISTIGDLYDRSSTGIEIFSDEHAQQHDSC